SALCATRFLDHLGHPQPQEFEAGARRGTRLVSENRHCDRAATRACVSFRIGISVGSIPCLSKAQEGNDAPVAGGCRERYGASCPASEFPSKINAVGRNSRSHSARGTCGRIWGSSSPCRGSGHCLTPRRIARLADLSPAHLELPMSGDG